MKSLPDHGDGFWGMFPDDGSGGIVLTEIDPDAFDGLKPDEDVSSLINAARQPAA